jgi:ubiquinone/menaquinone biosynthesis C-methylase UbiE
MIDSRERFSATAGLYDRFRPSYPADLVDWIVDTVGLGPGGTVADVGCGTGISTRLFAQRGFDAIGIDPNETMLAHARSAGGARYVVGEAVATGLPDRSVDLVTVAQAFHWFDVAGALEEFRRVLKDSGWCAAFWNERSSETAFMAEYDALLRRSSREYAVLESHEETLARIEAASGVVDRRRGEFRHGQRQDREAFFGLVFSSSYVVHGVPDRSGFEAALGDLFEKHRQGDVVEFHYRSVGLCFRLA